MAKRNPKRKAKLSNSWVSRLLARDKATPKSRLRSRGAGESYRPSSALLIPTKAQLQQAARQAGREYGKADAESGRGIKYSNMLVAFRDWLGSIPQLPRGVSERDLKGKFTGGYHTADILRNPFSLGETIAIGAGSAVGGALGGALVEPLIDRAKKKVGEIVNNPPKGKGSTIAVHKLVPGDAIQLASGLWVVKEIHRHPMWDDVRVIEVSKWGNGIIKTLEVRIPGFLKGYKRKQLRTMTNPFAPRRGANRGNSRATNNGNLAVETDIDVSPAVIRMSESFHGRPVETITDYEELEHYDEQLADLGALVELELVAKGKRSVVALSFDKDRPRLACRADGKQLYFVGGDQELNEDTLADLKRKGVDEVSVHTGEIVKNGKLLLPIGTVHRIAYFADKHHLAGSRKQKKGVEYEHTFGEENGVKPMLVYNVPDERLSLIGGDYRVEDVGIVN